MIANFREIVQIKGSSYLLHAPSSANYQCLYMVGVAGLEPATLGTPCRCATKLRYTPYECYGKFLYGKRGRRIN